MAYPTSNNNMEEMQQHLLRNGGNPSSSSCMQQQQQQSSASAQRGTPGPLPYLPYYIQRPASQYHTADGAAMTSGPRVPLIAADQLPQWLDFVGLPRELNNEQAAGMFNLGPCPKGEDLQAGFCNSRNTTAISKIVLGQGQGQDPVSISGSSSTRPVSGLNQRPDSPPPRDMRPGNPYPPIKSLPKDAAAVPVPKAQESAEHPAETRRRRIFRETIRCGEVDRSVTPAGGRQQQLPRVKAESPSESISSAATATVEKGRDVFRSKSVDNTKAKPRKTHTAGSSTTTFCRHWCHYGKCKWGDDCYYKHEMPRSKQALREVGLQKLPGWYETHLELLARDEHNKKTAATKRKARVSSRAVSQPPVATSPNNNISVGEGTNPAVMGAGGMQFPYAPHPMPMIGMQHPGMQGMQGYPPFAQNMGGIPGYNPPQGLPSAAQVYPGALQDNNAQQQAQFQDRQARDANTKRQHRRGRAGSIQSDAESTRASSTSAPRTKAESSKFRKGGLGAAGTGSGRARVYPRPQQRIFSHTLPIRAAPRSPTLSPSPEHVQPKPRPHSPDIFMRELDLAARKDEEKRLQEIEAARREQAKASSAAVKGKEPDVESPGSGANDDSLLDL